MLDYECSGPGSNPLESRFFFSLVHCKNATHDYLPHAKVFGNDICCDAKNSHRVCIEGEMMTATHLNHVFSVACMTFNCPEYKLSALKS